MEPVKPLGAEARGCLDAFRGEVPAPAAFEDNWRRLTAAVDAHDDHAGPDSFLPARSGSSDSVRRFAIAAGLAVAIAAAVLLLLRGTMDVATALGSRSDDRLEAVDQVEGTGEHSGAARDRSARPRAAIEPAIEPTIEPTVEPAVEAPRPDTAVPQGTDAAESAPRAPGEPARTTGQTGSEPEPATTQSDAARLAEETRLLREAREALARGEPRAAIAPLTEHEMRFPDGVLLEERMLYRAITRCRLTAPDPAETAAFARRFPRSPHAPRVRSECGEAP